MTGRANDGPSVTGDEVRDARFVRPRGKFARGYDAVEVDEVLRRIAAEVDAGRPVGPMIEKAEFRARSGTQAYETGAVDWFLELIRCLEDHSELARMSDPWRGWPVANYFSRRRPGDRDRAQDLEGLALECAEACRGFGRVPGTQLRWVVTPGRYSHLLGELLTAEQQEVASVRTRTFPVLRATVSTGGRTFTWRRVTGSARPVIAELVRRSHLDYAGRCLDADTPDRRKRQAARPDRAVRTLLIPDRAVRARLVPLRELVDETGTPILYTDGEHFNHTDGASITFPNQRWLEFPVRSTELANAIMTAVDQAGNQVARYRSLPIPGPLGCEITVHPGQELTTELVLALVISTPWLHSYFTSSGGGG